MNMAAVEIMDVEAMAVTKYEVRVNSNMPDNNRKKLLEMYIDKRF